MSKQEPDAPEVYRITSAAGSRSADMNQRAGRYLLSMAIRTLCVVLVIIVPGPLRWVFAVGAIVLPYVAVVAANAAGERRERPLPPPPPVPRRGLSQAPGAPAPYVPRPAQGTPPGAADPQGSRRAS